MITTESKEIFDKILANLPKPLVAIIENGKIPNTVDALASTYKLSPHQVGVLENNIFFVFLGIKPISKLNENLASELQLRNETVLDILDDLARILIKDEPLKYLLLIDKALAGGNSQIQQTNEKNIMSEIAETEAALETIAPLRTMATDGKQIGYASTEETTYTSHQSAILNEGKN